MANRFEHLVFSSTITRDEYVRTILQRMQQINEKYNSSMAISKEAAAMNPVEVNFRSNTDQQRPLDSMRTTTGPVFVNQNSKVYSAPATSENSDSVAISEKLSRLYSYLPAIDQLILGAINFKSTNPEIQTITDKLKSLKNTIQQHVINFRQLKAQYHQLPLLAATNLVDQVHHYSSLLKSLLPQDYFTQSKDGKDTSNDSKGVKSAPESNPPPTTDAPVTKASRKRPKKEHKIESAPRPPDLDAAFNFKPPKTIFIPPPFVRVALIAPLPRIFSTGTPQERPIAESMIEREIKYWQRKRSYLMIKYEVHRWGFSIDCRLGVDWRLGAEFPLEYPSDRCNIVLEDLKITSGRGEIKSTKKHDSPESETSIVRLNIDDEVENNRHPLIIAPVSLTAILNALLPPD